MFSAGAAKWRPHTWAQVTPRASQLLTQESNPQCALKCVQLSGFFPSVWLTKQWPNGLLGKKQFIKKMSQNKWRTQPAKTKTAVFQH